MLCGTTCTTGYSHAFGLLVEPQSERPHRALRREREPRTGAHRCVLEQRRRSRWTLRLGRSDAEGQFATPIRKLIAEADVPLDFLTSPDGVLAPVLDKLFFTSYAPIMSPDGFGVVIELVVAGEVSLALPGLDDFAFVIGSDGRERHVDQRHHLRQPRGFQRPSR